MGLVLGSTLTYKILAIYISSFKQGNFKLAEKHYVEASEWKTAVEMYRANDMWEEALRLAKQMGGSAAYAQVAPHERISWVLLAGHVKY